MKKEIFNIQNINIPFAAIQLTSKCNLSCDFCFRRLNIKEISFNRIKEVIKKLAEYNTTTLVLSGGEPLLVKDIKKILKFAKKLGIRTVLQSNGILLKKRLNSFAPYINWISLSLDGYNEQTNAIMRSVKQFKATVEILPLIKKHDIKIKLGTVVTKKNYKNIKDIGKLIQPYVTVWKLYQFYPRAYTYAHKNKNQFIIDDDTFLKTAKEIRRAFPKLSISTHSIKEFDKSPCLLMNPNGDVYITRNAKDYFIGNLVKEPDKFIENYKKMNIFSEINKNFNKTYKN